MKPFHQSGFNLHYYILFSHEPLVGEPNVVNHLLWTLELWLCWTQTCGISRNCEVCIRYLFATFIARGLSLQKVQSEINWKNP